MYTLTPGNPSPGSPQGWWYGPTLLAFMGCHSNIRENFTFLNYWIIFYLAKTNKQKKQKSCFVPWPVTPSTPFPPFYKKDIFFSPSTLSFSTTLLHLVSLRSDLHLSLSTCIPTYPLKVNKNKTLTPRRRVCVWQEIRVCVGAILREYVKLRVSVVWGFQSVAMGLGLSVSTPCFMSVCVTVRDVLHLKHPLDDSPSKWGSMCFFVKACVYSHI